jgi:hypothetical protein
MTDNPEALGLEQRCVEPGHWRIEGHDVKKGRKCWYVSYFDNYLTKRLTLRECREYIKDRIIQGEGKK